jgi:hypothetical protein
MARTVCGNSPLIVALLLTAHQLAATPARPVTGEKRNRGTRDSNLYEDREINGNK